MCCYTNQEKSKCLDKDVTVYKVFLVSALDGIRSPLYTKGSYEINKTIDCGIWDDNAESANLGFLEDILGVENVTQKNEVVYGFHSFTDKESAKQLRKKLDFMRNERNDVQDVRIYKCLIPKGTKIFTGITYLYETCASTRNIKILDEVVSEKIKILDEVVAE